MKQPEAELVEVPVVALAGLPVAGVVAQVRQRRTSDGVWTCQPAEGWEPMWRVLETVEIRHEPTAYGTPKVPWVYWTWQTEAHRALDCGYGGTTVERAERDGRTLLVAAEDAARLTAGQHSAQPGTDPSLEAGR